MVVFLIFCILFFLFCATCRWIKMYIIHKLNSALAWD